MSAKTTNKLPLFIGIAVGLGVLFIVILLVSGAGGKKLMGKSQKIEIKSGSDTLIVGADGQVELRGQNGSYYDTWSADKTNAFFDYFESKYKSQDVEGNEGGEYVAFYISGNKVYIPVTGDELVPIVIEDAGTQDGGGGGSGGGGEDVSHYFNNTPSPSGTVSPSQTNPPGGGGGGGDGACKYWRISYCVEFRTITPVITPTPGGSSRVLPPDCSDSGNKVTGRTVIGNELCVKSPSPTPQ